MKYSTEQVVKCLMDYADHEVMSKLPSSGKWILGTGIILASKKVDHVVEAMSEMPVVKVLGLIDEDGNIDADGLIHSMEEASRKYGVLEVEVPLIGTMKFGPSDVDKLAQYLSKSECIVL